MALSDSARTVKQPFLPRGWRWARLGEVSRAVGGSTPRSDESSYWSGDIVWVTPTDLGKLSERYVDESARHITQSGYDSCGTEIVPPGAVILSSRAPIGHLAIAAVPLCTNQGCKSFIPGDELDSDYLYFALKKSVPSLQAMGSGASFSEVSKSALEAFTIPLPPITEQRRIAALLTKQMEALERARAAAQAQIHTAKDLVATILESNFVRLEAQSRSRGRLGEVLFLRKEVVHPRNNPLGPAKFVGLEHIESGTGRRLGSVDLEMSDLTGRKPRFHIDDIVYGTFVPISTRSGWLSLMGSAQ